MKRRCYEFSDPILAVVSLEIMAVNHLAQLMTLTIHVISGLQNFDKDMEDDNDQTADHSTTIGDEKDR